MAIRDRPGVHADGDTPFGDDAVDRKFAAALAEAFVHGGQGLEESEPEDDLGNVHEDGGGALAAEGVASEADLGLDEREDFVEDLVEGRAGVVAFGSDELEQAIDEQVQFPGLLLDDIGALEGGGAVAALHACPEDFEIDDNGVQRILDFVREIVGEATHDVESYRAELLVIEFVESSIHGTFRK